MGAKFKDIVKRALGLGIIASIPWTLYYLYGHAPSAHRFWHWGNVDNMVASFAGGMIQVITLAMIVWGGQLVFKQSLRTRLKKWLEELATDEHLNEVRREILAAKYESSLDEIREVYIEIGDLNHLQNLFIGDRIRGKPHIWDYHVHTNKRTGSSFLSDFFDIRNGVAKVKTSVPKTAQVIALDATDFISEQNRRLDSAAIPPYPEGIFIKAIYRGRPEFKPIGELSLAQLTVESLGFLYADKGILWESAGALVMATSLIEMVKSRMGTEQQIVFPHDPSLDDLKTAEAQAAIMKTRCERPRTP